MPEIGRNDPCPCGSGRKYKKCCLEKDEARWRVQAAQDRVREDVIHRLLDYVEEAEFEEDLDYARDLFWADTLYMTDPALIRALIESPASTVNFDSWFLFDLDLDGGSTAADFFQDQHRAELNQNEVGYLTRMRASHLAPYTVASVRPGIDVTLTDLWTGETSIAIGEGHGARGLAAGDVVALRIVHGLDGEPAVESGGYRYPPGVGAHILLTLRTLHARFRSMTPDATDRLFFKRQGHVFHHLWLDLVAVPPELAIDTGIDQIRRVSFQVLDEGAVRVALAEGAGIEPNGDGSFLWTEPPGRFGRWYFAGDRLRFETSSSYVADSARDWLEAVAPAAVKHRVTALRLEDHRRADR